MATDQLATGRPVHRVICDTFAPLRLTALAHEIDDGGAYGLQWTREAANV